MDFVAGWVDIVGRWQDLLPAGWILRGWSLAGYVGRWVDVLVGEWMFSPRGGCFGR